ncbi:Gfo/Idh/MocA family protein [Fictibacillus fluitans]|uniref:Gfo/Idh/MocA family oxidoreductase n=1 Tax=Fictibacillus fluitans TaxID=3058422 RepID=A0ABT8HTP2_9BACL|nr:Gfo/Idh/MocA family oxidoreductase [Fictibacillus sp. NE201]MDN4524148.1 Gfo/Idh/MocA family oxidoreductase [Fictibacillus sp. NE201]
MKIVILGYGFIGNIHLSAYQKMNDVEVAGIYSTTKTGSIEGVPVYNDLDECLELADVVDICLPTFMHREVFEKAAARGKHIFLEKPMAHTEEDCRFMLELEQRSAGKVMVGQVLRYFPEYRQLKENIDPGKPASSLLSRRSQLPVSAKNWSLDRNNSGGVILDLLLHDIDFACWAFGPVTRIYAQSDAEYYYALLTLRHENGSITRLEGSWRYEGGFVQEAEIAQENELFTYNSQDVLPLQVHQKASASKDSTEIPAVLLRDDPWYLELREFIDAIRDDRPIPITLQDAYESTRVALLALKSADEKRPISLVKELNA